MCQLTCCDDLCCRAPHLQLAGLTKDITDDQLKELRDEIEKIARDNVGRVSVISHTVNY